MRGLTVELLCSCCSISSCKTLAMAVTAKRSGREVSSKPKTTPKPVPINVMCNSYPCFKQPEPNASIQEAHWSFHPFTQRTAEATICERNASMYIQTSPCAQETSVSSISMYAVKCCKHVRSREVSTILHASSAFLALSNLREASYVLRERHALGQGPGCIVNAVGGLLFQKRGHSCGKVTS